MPSISIKDISVVLEKVKARFKIKVKVKVIKVNIH